MAATKEELAQMKMILDEAVGRMDARIAATETNTKDMLNLINTTMENLNKILIKTLALHLLETRDIQPRYILAAGDWGRAWQDCRQKYKCLEI